MFRRTGWACNLSGGNTGSVLIGKWWEGGGATESFSRQVILVTWQAKWGFVQ